MRIAPPSNVSASATGNPGSNRNPVTSRTVTADTSGPATATAAAVIGLLNCRPSV
jgi:hypothetical protein